ncbi:MAG: sigma-54-dependent Fis family transcriptional regulator, partial [Deltaproteobacteria bacterium]|nr:sigma-54-dependent Fis family transcriptional regulator [Deltaproteobacteria bacterium]
QERQANNQSKTEVNRKPAILCLPFALKGQPKGVLYLDNSYLENCFDNIKAEFLNHLSDRLGKYIERIEEYSRFINRPRTQPVAYDAVVETGGTGTILSRDRKMNRILTQADRVAKTGATVLILGETGVGKEVLARWIHQKSHRNSEGSLVVIDPTTMPENLVESELFGHEKGAFTGAISQKSGRLELAHKGTLFIDEIGEISESIQVKLLRVIQEKSFTRVGGTKSIASDFRLLAATNRNLPAEVEAGRFRKDLYYRLNVMEFSIPPLRKRSDDIIQLANLFLATYARKYDRPGLRLSIENETVLKAYQWPGNIRELKNIIERAVLMSEQDELELNLVSDLGAPQANPFDDNPSFAEIQKRYITHVLSQTNNRISEAAKILKMNRSTLYTRIKKLGI